MGLASATAKFEISIENRPLSAAEEVLARLDFLYNLLALLQAYSEGYTFRLEQLRSALRSVDYLGVPAANASLVVLLTQVVSADDRLFATAMTTGSPLQVNLKGLAGPLKVLVSLFDPIKWMEKWEDLRHKKVSNRQKEEERQNALLRDHVANVRELLQLLDNVRQQAKQLTVAEDVSEDLLHLTRVEVYRLMRSLESENMRLRSLPAAAA